MTNDQEVRVLHATDAAEPQNAQTERVVRGEQLSANIAQRPLGAEGELGRLQLLEERAVVNVERVGMGQVQIRKVVHERQEMVPVTITSEVLEITVASVPAGATQPGQVAGAAGSQGVREVLIDGQPLEAGRTYTIPLTEERYQVVKQVYPISDVVVRRRVQTETHQETLSLKREELDVQADESLIRRTEGQAIDKRR
ncbi:MAG: DUF2382 domain-containing protein [Deinococcus sp.]|uniref:YsnF/AvaK domain-containing protein n=1 Tax=Deinococcus sp. TaxID=47478 RepID=UPI0026DBF58C|nr:DUF2382 domain-containing protein [Deinococcus sp.]MDO4245474.1 DUF2382 domain-containing protein [Deinococcus sp.]